MQTVFLELVKLSLIGSLFAAAVMLVRLVFRKAPKWLFCVLWGVVALRLICPVSIESSLSLVPDRLASGQIFTNVGNEYIGDVDIIYESNAGYSNAIEAGRQPIYSGDGYYVVTEKDSLEAPKTVGGTIYPILSWVWVAGMVLMFAYTAVSYLVLRKKMEEATHLRENIWQCEQVDSPFVLGIIKPQIYLPYAITESDMANVIAHEQAHIHRKDHWWKPIGFLLLSVHWFNPVLWLAYILLCRDIEAACDEKVIKHMEKDEMRAYSTALLNCSVHRRRIAACPLAFGEVGVKERIKRVMNYKKPAFWIIVAAVVACSVAVICFVTNPKDGKLPNIHSHAYVVEEVTYESGTYSFSVVAGENSPIYAITEDMTLVSQKEVSEEGIWAQLGKLEEIKLTKDNFDELFFSKGLWAENANAKSIRKNTVNAWQLIYNQDVLYYVLQQKNGDLYLAYGYYDYSEKNDPYSDDTNIRWLFKLTIDTSGMSGMVVKSGDGVVPMVSFPEGTMIKDYVDSIYWLTINPGDEELVPFSVWKDGEEQRGFYTAYDAITFEPLKHFIPSGLDPQTYLFQKADPTRGYIVLATFSTEPNAEIYAFGARFDSTISSVGGADSPSNVMTTKSMTLDEVFELAAKGDDLTWEDLKRFSGYDIGSGLYVIRYDIDSDFYLLVGGGDLTGKPLYAMLCCVSGDQHVDITTGDVKEFINTYRPSALDCAITDAISEHYHVIKPDGLIHTQSYVIVGTETTSGTPLQGQNNHMNMITAYLVVRAKTYSVSTNGLAALEGGVLIPAMLRFSVDAEDSYRLEEYWTPSTEGYVNDEFNHDEVIDKFPAEVAEKALDTDEYVAQLNQRCDSKALAYLDKIENSVHQALIDKYPEYYQLNTDKGLEIYVYQMSAKLYSCVLVSAKDDVYRWDELLKKPSTTMDEMREIVQSYRLDRSMISIIPIQMPHSSYLYTIDDAYKAKLEGMFWAEYQDVQEPFTGIIDSVSFDIDGDGKQEMCTLGHGPTSGLFSFTFMASPMEVTASTPKYSEVFVMAGHYKLSFEITDGVLRIKGDSSGSDEKVVFFDVTVKDGHIVLQCEEEGIFFN